MVLRAMAEAMKNSLSLRNLIDRSQPMLDNTGTSKPKEIEPKLYLLGFSGFCWIS